MMAPAGTDPISPTDACGLNAAMRSPGAGRPKPTQSQRSSHLGRGMFPQGTMLVAAGAADG